MSLKVRQKEIVQEHFQTVGTQWGGRYASAPRKMSDLDLWLRRDNVHRLLKPLAETDGRTLQVLDLGCGSGDVLDGFSRKSIDVTGVDFAYEMIASAAASHPLDRFLIADIARLPIAPETMDVVTCIGVLEYIPDPLRVLKLIHRTLRPQGQLIVSFPNRASLFRKLSTVEIRAERSLLSVWHLMKGRADQDNAAPRYHHTRWSLSGIRALLTSAGFQPEEILFNTYGLYGRIGHWPISLSLSRWMSDRFARPGFISTMLAGTIVLRAGKTGAGHG